MKTEVATCSLLQ